MAEGQFHRNNHFVSRSYLKRWAGPDGRVTVYRLLVSDERVPEWKRASPTGLAFHEHLYTSIAGGVESDELERWLDREFETPAEGPISRVIDGRRLDPTDWTTLARFLAAQDARTPARFEEHFLRYEQQMPQLIERSLKSALRKRAEIIERGHALPEPPPGQDSSSFPFRVSVAPNSDGEGGQLVGEALNGRALWLFGIRRALTVPIQYLLRQRWTILRPPAGETFVTSDNPVVRLSYRGPEDYDLRGGWGVPGTDIMMPLGPEHLLYTQIDRSVPVRGTRMAVGLFELLKRITIENAYRHVITLAPDPGVSAIRPRTVDPDRVLAERDWWTNWHQNNAEAEAELRRPL